MKEDIRIIQQRKILALNKIELQFHCYTYTCVAKDIDYGSFIFCILVPSISTCFCLYICQNYTPFCFSVGRVLLMLGKVQLELQKLVDSYRAHIFQTITIPSESILNELRIVEEMKKRCDEKREIYEDLVKRSKDKGRIKSSKGEGLSPHQLEVAQDEYDEEANTFVFRMKSLKQGQSRSLLTQAARHHAAQLSFLRKALKSLESIEPHVKLVAEELHIDYQFHGLEDDGNDDYEDYDDDDGDAETDSESQDDSELSFDNVQSDEGQDVSATRTSMELDNLDVTFPQVASRATAKEKLDRSSSTNSLTFRQEIKISSKSGPIYPEKKFDASMRHSPSQRFNSYVLPTPQEAKVPISGKLDSIPQARRASLSNIPLNLWHSSPLQQNKYEKIVTHYSGPILKESNGNTKSSRVLSHSTEGLSPPRLDSHRSDNKKAKTRAFSGPLTGKSWPNKPVLSASGPITANSYPDPFSVSLLRNPVPSLSSTAKLSSRVSPNFVSSPKISELHELPRPPAHFSRPPNRIIHSGPLISKGRDFPAVKNSVVMRTAASTLPVPPEVIPRSYSIPSRGQIEAALHGSKPMETPETLKINEVMPSPPLTPISIAKVDPISPAS
ncbi:OLC1v1028537C2 [Oldenlandia corymbosa var. corymbosa]|uniref:OLC1v1028537C2 n=1 Tax=Oldenlandia corymbosa var. corymbosa TaxID=529605 RepID=A0AAV1CEU0_OLDCO|nr:OLC1v1028537C2 [Oldenlandia corymbosa var. corymbosa]